MIERNGKIIKQIAIKFRQDCWIYPKISERNNMNNIIDLLKQNKSLSTYAIFREIKKSSHSIRNALHYLLVLKVVNVEQHYYTRIWRLTKDWNVCLNKAIIEYNP